LTVDMNIPSFSFKGCGGKVLRMAPG